MTKLCRKCDKPVYGGTDYCEDHTQQENKKERKWMDGVCSCFCHCGVTNCEMLHSIPSCEHCQPSPQDGEQGWESLKSEVEKWLDQRKDIIDVYPYFSHHLTDFIAERDRKWRERIERIVKTDNRTRLFCWSRH